MEWVNLYVFDLVEAAGSATQILAMDFTSLELYRFNSNFTQTYLVVVHTAEK